MVTGNASSEKESFLLVLFRYGEDASVEARYTNWEEAYSGYSPEPRMRVEVPPNTGGLDKREAVIGLPLDSGFISVASAPTAFSPIYVQITEVTRGLTTGVQNTIKTLFSGRVTEAIRNYEGVSDMAAFVALPRKSRLDYPLVPPTTHQCPWTLFQSPCGAVQSSHQVQAEIDSLDGLEVTATNANIAAQAGADTRYWHRGFLEKDGLRIGVADYDGSVDATKFRLHMPPPTDWIGGTSDILFVAGCDKSIETCRTRFSQEANFGGIGYAMQPYNPNWESPQ